MNTVEVDQQKDGQTMGHGAGGIAAHTVEQDRSSERLVRAIGLILENDLDHQRWRWLCSVCSEDSILRAASQLGRKRPYVTNIATAAGLKLPPHLVGGADSAEPGADARRPPAQGLAAMVSSSGSDADDEMVQVGCRMPRAQWLALKQHALHHRMTLQEVLNMAASQFLRQHRGRS